MGVAELEKSTRPAVTVTEICTGCKKLVGGSGLTRIVGPPQIGKKLASLVVAVKVLVSTYSHRLCVPHPSRDIVAPALRLLARLGTTRVLDGTFIYTPVTGVAAIASGRVRFRVNFLKQLQQSAPAMPCRYIPAYRNLRAGNPRVRMRRKESTGRAERFGRQADSVSYCMPW